MAQFMNDNVVCLSPTAPTPPYVNKQGVYTVPPPIAPRVRSPPPAYMPIAVATPAPAMPPRPAYPSLSPAAPPTQMGELTQFATIQQMLALQKAESQAQHLRARDEADVRYHREAREGEARREHAINMAQQKRKPTKTRTFNDNEFSVINARVQKYGDNASFGFGGWQNRKISFTVTNGVPYISYYSHDKGKQLRYQLRSMTLCVNETSIKLKLVREAPYMVLRCDSSASAKYAGYNELVRELRAFYDKYSNYTNEKYY